MRKIILNKKINLRKIFYLLMIILFFIIIILMYKSGRKSTDTTAFTMEQCWTDEDGNKINLNILPEGEKVSLFADVSNMELDDKRFCLKSIDTVFEIYADGELIYSYRPVNSKLLGSSYGMYVHTIRLPENTSKLNLQAEPIFYTASVTLKDIVTEDSGTYMADLYKENLPAFVRSTMTMLIGILFLVIGISNGVLSQSVGLDFTSFGMMCTLLGFSGLNDTYLLQVMTQQPALIRVITYLCLIFLPYPALLFFASATQNRNSRLLTVMKILCLTNFVATVLLTFLGITDYFYMINISHFIIVLDFFSAIFLVIRSAMQHKIQTHLLQCLTFGLAACILGTGADVLRYHLSWDNGYSSYSRISILLFMIFIGIYLLQEQIRALKQKEQENKTFITEITEAFAKVIDMKDKYTNGHSTRVAKYTAMLAEELGYDEETVEKYYRIALLHDIGKIGIPMEVLNKPGKLTDEEFEIIKAHAQKGYDVLKNISIMPELAIGAGAHHERPDGKGYPNGLKGNEIPRVAQIIAVADTFDAMYSNRPYRKRMNFEKAVSIIKEVSGTQLTSDVVDAFLRLVERGKFRAKDDNGGGTTENIDNIHQKFEQQNSSS